MMVLNEAGVYHPIRGNQGSVRLVCKVALSVSTEPGLDSDSKARVSFASCDQGVK